MKILATGYSGFVGQHLMQQMKIVPLEDDRGNFIELSNLALLEAKIAEVKPDAVIHLAAQSNVPASFKDPLQTYEINFLGTLNLLQVLKKTEFRGRFLFISSGDIYGITETLPINESLMARPRNPYAVSKVAAEALCYQFSQTEQFAVMVARPFNHIGPGQLEQFAVSGFAKQVAAIKLGLQDPVIEVGDLGVTRDFTDVRDIVKAYELLLHHGRNGQVYNVCTGIERSLKDVLNLIIAEAGVQVTLREVSERLRPTEQRRVRGSCKKLLEHTGWVPQIPLSHTLRDILNDWERKLTCANGH